MTYSVKDKTHLCAFGARNNAWSEKRAGAADGVIFKYVRHHPYNL